MKAHVLGLALFVLTANASVSADRFQADITDRQGSKTPVEGLQGLYTPALFFGETWLGRRPEQLRESLFILLTKVEGRVTASETLELPFRSLRRVICAGKVLPEDAGPWDTPSARISVPAEYSTDFCRVEKRDGSVLLLYDFLFLERKASGEQSRAVCLASRNGLRFSTGEQKEERFFELSELRGTAKTPSGQSGVYSIDWRDVGVIEFR